MTNNQHGQVPEALIDLIDAYAETRHRCCGIYNAKTEAARKAVIEALSGVQALSAAPAGWKLVPVEPTDEMLKAADDGDDEYTLRNFGPGVQRVMQGPYDHYCAMLAASPTPPAEQTFITPETGNSASAKGAAITSESGTPPAEQQAAPKAAPGDVLDEALRERDDAEDFIDALLDEVLGHERPEWSSSYGHADALNDVQERMTALHKPAVDKAWGRFQSAMAVPQQEAQEPAVPPCISDAYERIDRFLRNNLGDEDYADFSHDLELLCTAQPTPQPVPAPLSEREAFEAWIEKDGGDLGTFGTPPNMHYRNSSVNNAWVAWKARAALAAQGGK